MRGRRPRESRRWPKKQGQSQACVRAPRQREVQRVRRLLPSPGLYCDRDLRGALPAHLLGQGRGAVRLTWCGQRLACRPEAHGGAAEAARLASGAGERARRAPASPGTWPATGFASFGWVICGLRLPGARSPLSIRLTRGGTGVACSLRRRTQKDWASSPDPELAFGSRNSCPRHAGRVAWHLELPVGSREAAAVPLTPHSGTVLMPAACGGPLAGSRT